MTFQFTCPQGHLIEAEESQTGAQCQCPQCGTMMVVPDADAPQNQPSGQPSGAGGGRMAFLKQESAGISDEGPGAGFPQLGSGAAGPSADDPLADSENTFVHIPCPNGHMLEVHPDEFGLEMSCPHCNESMLLRERDSLEYKKRKTQQRAVYDHHQGKFWMNIAIIFSVLIALAIIAMIAMSMMR